MKRHFYFLTLFAFYALNNLNAQTSVADGNWSSPSTWGGAPPIPGGTVVINNNVTLDMDYGYTSGSVTINASGSLTGNSTVRAFALLGGTLIVSGTLDVAIVGVFSGFATNNGTFQMDSLYDTGSLTNNANGVINATQFMIDVGGTFSNNGTVTSTNFLNVATVTNNGSISSNDLLNSKSFTNFTTGNISITFNFSNTDSLASPAVFTNDGSVGVGNDWYNSSQIGGSGKFCVVNNTWNIGTMSGTFDFCDQSGGSVDLNTGTISGTITYCTALCTVGIEESEIQVEINTFPNPSDGIFTVSELNGNFNNTIIEIFNMLGEKVFTTSLHSEKTIIDLSSQPKGIYFYQVKDEKQVLKSEKIIVE